MVYFCSQNFIVFGMTQKDIKSIILYLDSAEAIEYLTNEQTGILFKAVFRYARTGQKPVRNL